MSESFIDICKKGNVKDLKKLLRGAKEDYYASVYYDGLNQSLFKENLEISRWLVENKKDKINLKKYFLKLDEFFAEFVTDLDKSYCDTVKFLLSVGYTFDKESCEWYFEHSCDRGKLDLAKLFYSIEYDNKKIDITKNFNYAFSFSFTNGHQHVTEWIMTLENFKIKDNELMSTFCGIYDCIVGTHEGMINEDYLKRARWLCFTTKRINLGEFICPFDDIVSDIFDCVSHVEQCTFIRMGFKPKQSHKLYDYYIGFLWNKLLVFIKFKIIMMRRLRFRKFLSLRKEINCKPIVIKV